MPPKRNRNRSKNKKQINALAECVIPQEIMASILTRLPVKSLLRCKSVCKPWLELISTPNFIKLHHRQFSSDPRNENFMVYSLSKSKRAHTMSLHKVMSHKNPAYVDHPYPEDLCMLDFVGCCNGLICLACPPLGEYILLWNPAMRLWKQVKLSKVQPFGSCELVSIGFGYDEDEEDFKVVRIVYLAGPKMKMKPFAEVYSAKSDSWKTIKVGLQFRVVSSKCNVVVGGDPYWNAIVGKIGSQTIQIILFDVKKLMFKTVPLSSLRMGEDIPAIMNWKGSLAYVLFLGSRVAQGCGYSMHVMTYLKERKIWSLEHFDPLPMNIDRCMQCSKSGKVVGMNYDGKVFVFDLVSGLIKMAIVQDAVMLSFQICEYIESLVCFDGMEMIPVKVSTKEDEDGPSTSGRPPMDIAELFRRRMQLQHAATD